MPNTQNVEERIVEMRIDNKRFESGAKQTISTLEKLEKALNIKGGNTDALDNLEKSMSKFDASPMTKSLEKVQMSFSALEVAGLRVIQNLTDSIYNFATKTIKNLTIDQVTAGFDKYEKMTESIQTIMAATRDQIGQEGGWADEAEQMEAVNAAMERLLWYSDETSYSFTDMADNVGKFLAAGVGLEDAVQAMMGIASWGASAGAKPAEVARAMYNISQAMGQGSMQLMDWKSIENANMATLEFKRNVLAVAQELGVLDQVMYETDESTAGYISKIADERLEANAEGIRYISDFTEKEVDKIFNDKSFREGLKDKWFNVDVMTEVFNRYGAFANLLNEAYNETGLETRGLLDLLDEFRDAEKDAEKTVNWNDWADGSEVTAERLQEIVQALANIGIEYSENGFRMGQEAKTFTDAIEATKDAVSSGWMKMFQYIFGDYIQAKDFWSNVTDELWEIFASGAERRNAVLKEWSRAQDAFGRTGRDYLLARTDEFQGAMWDLLDAIRTITGPIKAAWSEIFGLGEAKEAGVKLREFTKRFKEFTEQLGFSKEGQEGIKNFFKVIFSVLKVGVQVAGEAVKIFGKLAMVFGEIGDAFFRLLGGDLNVSEFFDIMKDRIKSLIPTGDQLKGMLSDILDRVKNFAPTEEQLLNFFKGIRDYAQSGYTAVKNWFSALSMEKIRSYIPSMERVSEIYHKITGYIWENYPTIAKWLYDLKETSIVGAALDGLNKFFRNASDWLRNLPLDTEKWASRLQDVRSFLEEIVLSIFGNPEELKARLQTTVSIIIETLREEFGKLTFSDIYKAFKAIGLGAIFVELSGVFKNLKKIEQEMKGIPESISGFFNNLSESLGQSFRANSYIKMAVALGILAGSIYLLAKIDEDKLTHTVVVMGLLFVLLSRLTKTFEGGNFLSKQNVQNIKKFQVIGDVAGALIGLGVAIFAVVRALRVMADIQTSGASLKSVVGALAVIVGMLSAVTLLFSKLNNEKWGTTTSGMLRTASSLIVVVAAVRLMMKPIKQLAEIQGSEQSLSQAMKALGVILLGMAGLVTVFSLLNHSKIGGNTSNILSTAGSLAIVALAVRALVKPLREFAEISASELSLQRAVMALAAITGVMTFMVGMMSFIKPTKIMASAGAMALMAVAINLLMPALVTLGGIITAAIVKIPWSKITEDMGGFWEVLKALAGLSGALVLFGVAMKLIGTGVLRFGAGVVAISGSVFLFSLGITAVALAMKLAASAIPEFLNGILEARNIIVENLDAFLEIVSTILLGVALVVIGRKLQIAEAFGQVALAILQKVQGMSPQLIKVIGGVLAVVGGYLLGIIPGLTDYLVNAIVVLLDSLADAIDKSRAQLVASITKIIKTILEVVSEVFDSIFNKEFLSSLNTVEKILLGFATLKVSGSGISQLVGIFKDLSTVIGGSGGGKGGLLGKLKDAKAAIELLIEAAGGMAVIGPAIMAIGGALYATANIGSQEKQYKEEAFGGLDPNDLMDYATAIENATNAVRRAKQDYDNLSLYGGDLTMADEELSVRQNVLNNLYKDFAEQLGISTDELQRQIEATNGDITQIDALKVKLEETNSALNETAKASDTYNEAANEKLAMKSRETTAAVDETKASVESFRELLSGIDFSEYGFDLDISQLTDMDLSAGLEQLKSNGIDLGLALQEGTQTGINDNSGLVLEALGLTSEEGINTLRDYWQWHSPSGVTTELGKSIDEGIQNGINANAAAPHNALVNLFNAMASSFNNVHDMFVNSGVSVVSGLVEGIGNNLDYAYNIGQNLGASVLNGFNEKLSIHSPSRVFRSMARFIPEGISQGINDGQDGAIDSIVILSDALVQAIQQTMAQVGMFADEDFSFSPMITPVVDMSNVTAASGSIGNAFGGSYGIAADMSRSISSRVNDVERLASNMSAGNTVNNGDNITFNIYASDGMDENAIADAVMSKMQTRFAQRRVAFG